MKNLKFVLLIIIVMMQGLNGQSQVKDKDSIIKKIYVIIVNDDVEGFVRLFPDVNTMRRMVSNLAGAELSEEQKEAVFKELTAEKLQSGYREEFDGIRKMVKDAGIKWTNSKLVSYKVDSTENDGMPQLNGTIYFNSNGSDYFLNFSEIIYFENGWYGVTIGRIDLKTKE